MIAATLDALVDRGYTDGMQISAIQTETLSYVSDGLEMVGTLYSVEASPKPLAGVSLFPEAFGPGPNVHSRARRLAELGYAALACDLHGGGALIQNLEKVMELVAPLRTSPTRARARVLGAFEALRSHPIVDGRRMAALGFCIGGTLALELARSGADLACVVGFHAGLATRTPEDARNIKGKVLVCTGADDPSIPEEQRSAFVDEMKTARVNWAMHLYGGVVHAFTNREAGVLGRPDFARYDESADRQSWLAMTTLLEECFGQEDGSALAAPRQATT